MRPGNLLDPPADLRRHRVELRLGAGELEEEPGHAGLDVDVVDEPFDQCEAVEQDGVDVVPDPEREHAEYAEG